MLSGSHKLPIILISEGKDSITRASWLARLGTLVSSRFYWKILLQWMKLQEWWRMILTASPGLHMHMHPHMCALLLTAHVYHIWKTMYAYYTPTQKKKIEDLFLYRENKRAVSVVTSHPTTAIRKANLCAQSMHADYSKSIVHGISVLPHSSFSGVWRGCQGVS